MRVSVPINKASLAHGHTFRLCLWLLHTNRHCAVAKRWYGLQNQKYLLSVPLQSFLTLGLYDE